MKKALTLLSLLSISVLSLANKSDERESLRVNPVDIRNVTLFVAITSDGSTEYNYGRMLNKYCPVSPISPLKRGFELKDWGFSDERCPTPGSMPTKNSLSEDY